MLQNTFSTIAATRMKGVPVQNPALRVEAVGFAAVNDGGLGILITPWFMNLVRLPLSPNATTLGVGQKAEYAFGTERFEFIGALEDGIGAFETCSLFSPMFEFADHAAAVATAQEVLKLLRKPVDTVQAPARRGFLLGRRT